MGVELFGFKRALALSAAFGALLLALACESNSTSIDDPSSGGRGASSSGAGTSGGATSGAADAGGAASGAADAAGAPGGDEGGASNGGSAGAPPVAGAGDGGGGVPAGEGGSSGAEGAECESDDDCAVFNDCCTCAALPAKNLPGECERLCIQSACAARALEGATAVCRSKRCVLDLSCDRSLVTCKVATPTCEAGMVPSVDGPCWGPCIPPAECNAVTDCKDCGAGQVCVSSQNFATFTRCVDVARECAASPTCACTDACEFSCSDADGIGCFCINC